jgi:flavin reductase (DIM6/NTAB) family NADH-FMN oxidoreductase RutF
MKKSFGPKPLLMPMPVLMIATYDENDKVDVMNMAWGGVCDDDQVALNLSEDHKTVKNLYLHKAFTLSVANAATAAESDYFGLASGNRVNDKFERTGLHAVPSTLVHAPIVEEYPITLECEVIRFEKVETSFRVVGRVKNCLIDESVLDEKGKPDATKINPLIFDTCGLRYFSLGKEQGKAFNLGMKYMKK